MRLGWGDALPPIANFDFCNPTRIIFGRGGIAQVDQLVPAGARVLLTYGGGSIHRNGVHAAVVAALGPRLAGEFGGIRPNPTCESLLPGLERIRRTDADFLLAVGGGSVIDATKFLAAAVRFDGDPWTMVADGAPIGSALPLGTVLTLPGTGSEMNHWSVISRAEPCEKRSFGSPLLAPRFSVLDPEVTYSLPPRQVVNGVIDAFVHVLEQYLTYPVDAPLQDRLAESVLLTLIDEGRRTVAEPLDYAARANVIWSATLALNGLLAAGVPEDWASHTIGHELTALYGLDHAVTLAIVVPALLTHQAGSKRAKLLQYGARVWGIVEGSHEARIAATIVRTRGFFEGFGVATTLAQHGIGAGAAYLVADRLAARGVTALGERAGLTIAGVRELLRLAA